MTSTNPVSFDHSQYRDEVEQRWGSEAHAEGDRWWRSTDAAAKQEFIGEQARIAAAFGAARAAGLSADCEQVQQLAADQVRWLTGIPGIPTGPDGGPANGYVIGLGEMYVADPRFSANFDRHAPGTAALVRDALLAYADRCL
jgi:hypothetical protein